MKTTRLLPMLALGGLLATGGPARAEGPGGVGRIVDRVGFDQKLGEALPLDLTFRDENGQSVRLKDYFGRRPVILTPVYFNCPMLCTETLNGLARALKPLTPSIGQDFEVITVSIDPTETPELARLKRAAYLKRYDREGAERGWHFLTGDQAAIAALTQAIGFRYTYNPRTRQYAHAAGFVILTPQGVISRYLYGIEYSPRDVQFGLMESSAGRIGSALAWLPLLCYDYDAATGKYTLAILRLTRVLGTGTFLVLAGVVVQLLRRERRARAAQAPPARAATS
jgi:protein SCO1/2